MCIHVINNIHWKNYCKCQTNRRSDSSFGVSSRTSEGSQSDTLVLRPNAGKPILAVTPAGHNNQLQAFLMCELIILFVYHHSVAGARCWIEVQVIVIT